MGIAYFGANRMATWQTPRTTFQNRFLTHDKPQWGLGPKGMPGSADYGDDLTWRERNSKGPSQAPNPYERMGLFWTGERIAQGRPIRDIEQGQALEERRMGLAERGQALNAEETQARLGLEGQRVGLEGERVGLEGNRVALEGQRVGLLGQAQAVNAEESAARLGLERQGLGMRAAGLMQDIAFNRERLGLMRREDRRAEEVHRAGLMAPKGRGEIPGYIPPETVMLVERALDISPDAADYNARLERLAKEMKIKGGAGMVKNVLQSFGPYVREARAARLAGTPEAATLRAEQAQREAIARRRAGLMR
ncbi:MAG: hypothetical protein PHR35_20840 [Kiritimatiellae bacterium]|nr:hypothetical protein [Kiritimatiellia bacterium]